MDAGARDALPDKPAPWERGQDSNALQSEQAREDIKQAESDRELSRRRAERFLTLLSDPDSRQWHDGELFDLTALAGLRNVTSKHPGHCACEFPVQKRNANTQGTLHGGCTGAFLPASAIHW
jgi:hypothetical protein